MRRESQLVSIYLVNYNYAQYVARSIRSVIAQTYQNIELIVIDDGSTDDSREIINHELSRHGECAISVSKIFQENKGLTRTNNIALNVASGEFIMRLDADDWLAENAVECLINAFNESPEAGLVFSDYYEVSVTGEILAEIKRHDFDQLNILDMPAHGACTLFRTENLKFLGGYDKEFDRQDGFEIWLRFIRQFRVKNISEPLFYYRQHAHSLTTNEERLLHTRSRILSKSAREISEKSNNRNAVVIPVSSQFGIGVKCLEPLGPKPLINWTIDTAIECRRVDLVIVTCSDENIIEHVRQAYSSDVVVVDRPLVLSESSISLQSVVIESLLGLDHGLSPESGVAVLGIENPFRQHEQIDNLFDVLEIFAADSVIAVRRDDSELMRHGSNGMTRLIEQPRIRNERDAVYRKSGSLQAIKFGSLNAGRWIFDGITSHLMIDEKTAMDVRSPFGWRLAELIAANPIRGDILDAF